MKKAIIIIYILMTMLFANIQEEENKEMIEISKDIIKNDLKVLYTYNQRAELLLVPRDMNGNILVLTRYNEKHESFKSGRKNLKKNVGLDVLVNFYINALEDDNQMKFTSYTQFLQRTGYETNVLYYLKKDINKNNFSSEERKQIVENIKKLIILDNKYVYQTIKAENTLYAKNIKKYIKLMAKERTKNIVYNDHTYQKFLFYLNKGEELLFNCIKHNDNILFNEFIKNERTILLEERSKILKNLKEHTFDSSLYTNYWIRTQIYQRYIGRSDWLSSIYRIEKQKNFFESVLSEK